LHGAILTHEHPCNKATSAPIIITITIIITTTTIIIRIIRTTILTITLQREVRRTNKPREEIIDSGIKLRDSAGPVITAESATDRTLI
jgi:hypothetical protein